jgi:cbb3-type cytochrome oxidase subunit 3
MDFLPQMGVIVLTVGFIAIDHIIFVLTAAKGEMNNAEV